MSSNNNDSKNSNDNKNNNDDDIYKSVQYLYNQQIKCNKCNCILPLMTEKVFFDEKHIIHKCPHLFFNHSVRNNNDNKNNNDDDKYFACCDTCEYTLSKDDFYNGVGRVMYNDIKKVWSADPVYRCEKCDIRGDMGYTQ